MRLFAEVFPQAQIVSAARRQLSWTHVRTLSHTGNPLKRDFYLQMYQLEPGSGSVWRGGSLVRSESVGDERMAAERGRVLACRRTAAESGPADKRSVT